MPDPIYITEDRQIESAQGPGTEEERLAAFRAAMEAYFAGPPTPGYVNAVSQGDRERAGDGALSVAKGGAIEVLYGRRRIEGKLLGRFTSSGDPIVLMYAFGAGTIDRFETIYRLDADTPVEIEESGTCVIGRHYGAFDQPVSSTLAFYLGEDFRFPGTTFITVKIWVSDPQYADLAAGTARITADVRGRIVLDPRDNRLTYSEDFSDTVWTFDAPPTVATGIADEWGGTFAARWTFPGSGGPHSASRSVPLVQAGSAPLVGVFRLRSAGAPVSCDLEIGTDLDSTSESIDVGTDWEEHVLVFAPVPSAPGTTASAMLALTGVPDDTILEIEPGASIQAYDEDHGYARASGAYGKTVLDGAIGSPDEILIVEDWATSPDVVPFQIQIGTEQIRVDDVKRVPGVWGVTRGVNGSSAAVHADGATVTLCTQLNGAVVIGATSLVVDSTVGLPPPPFDVLIEAETVSVTAVPDATHLTCAALSANHADNKRVTLASDVGFPVLPGIRWSADNALVDLSWMTDPVYGAKLDPSRFNLASFGRAAAQCDERPDGTGPRFSFNGLVGASGTADQWIEAIRATFAAEHYTEDGLMCVWVPGPQGDPVMSFDEDFNPRVTDPENAGPAKEIAPSLLGSTERPTRVTIEYQNPDKNFDQDQKTAEHPGLAAGRLSLVPSSLRLDGLIDGAIAQRLADYYVDDARLCPGRAEFTVPFLGNRLRKMQLISFRASQGFASDMLVLNASRLKDSAEFRVTARQWSDALVGASPRWVPMEPLDGVKDGANRLFSIPSGPALDNRGIVRWRQGQPIPPEFVRILGSLVRILAPHPAPEEDDQLDITFATKRGRRPVLTAIFMEPLAGDQDGSNDTFTAANPVSGNRGKLVIGKQAVSRDLYTITADTIVCGADCPKPKTYDDASKDGIWLTYEAELPDGEASDWAFGEVLAGTMSPLSVPDVDANRVFLSPTAIAGEGCEIDFNGPLDPDLYDIGSDLRTITFDPSLPAPRTYDDGSTDLLLITHKK